MRKTLLFFSFFLGCKLVFSQSTYPVSDASVFMRIMGGNTNSPEDTLVSSGTQLKGSFVIVLNDTTGISKLHVKMGTSDGASNLFSKIYTFDQAGTFSDGTSYERKGNVVYLGLGDYTGLNSFFAEVKIETLSGGFSIPYKYKTN